MLKKMKIVLASRNKKKKKELQALLSQYIEGIEILSLDDVGIYGEIEEDGETFDENALIKARTAAESGYIGVGDDSGLEVDALGGAPGSNIVVVPVPPAAVFPESAAPHSSGVFRCNLLRSGF